MVLDLEVIGNLMFKFVTVRTNIRRTKDFESDFSIDKPEFPNGTNNQTLLTYSGYLKAFDPITKSAILCSIENNKVINNILILGHSIDQIQLKQNDKYCNEARQIIEADSIEKSSQHPYFHRPGVNSITDEELLKRREDIISWLKKNRIPMEVNQDTSEIIIAESARVRPPYEHEIDYICSTRIVLTRLKHIIDSRPSTN